MRKLSKTGITNLWRNEKGIYYLVAKIAGKRVTRSLKTDSKALARELLPDKLRSEKARAASAAGLVPIREGSSSPGTWSAICQDWLDYQNERPDLQQRSKDYYRDVVSYALEDLSASQLVARATRAEMLAWWSRVASRYAESTANNILGVVKSSLHHAADSGLEIPPGIMSGCRKLKLPPSELIVPTNDQLEAILLEVETVKKSSSAESRDLIEFLAFVGCRIGEAREVTWGDIKPAEILIRGKADAKGRARTKGHQFRRVPIADRVARLLDRRRFPGSRPADPVFQIQSPKKSLSGACRRLGLPHLRVHDLRHFFATHCIERGVDIPTVSSWLGHQDGGVLAMKLYGHVRNQHSQQMGKLIG